PELLTGLGVESVLRVGHDRGGHRLGLLLRDALGPVDERELVHLLLGHRLDPRGLEPDPAPAQLPLSGDLDALSRAPRDDGAGTQGRGPIETAPASSPASPASRITRPLACPPATPMTSARFETRPSFTPKIAARSAPDASPRCQRSPRTIPVRTVEGDRPATTRAWTRSSTAIERLA